MTQVEEKLLGAVSATSQALKLIALQIATKNDKVQAIKMLTDLISVLDVSIETTRALDKVRTEVEVKAKKKEPKKSDAQSLIDMIKSFAEQQETEEQEEEEEEENFESEEAENQNGLVAVNEEELPVEIKELLGNLRSKFAGKVEIGVKAFKTN